MTQNLDNLKIVIVDNLELESQRVKNYLHLSKLPIEKVEICENFFSFENIVKKKKVDVFLLNASSFSKHIFDMIKITSQYYPDSSVIVLADEEDQFLADQVIQCGAQDFILKNEVSFRTLESIISSSISRSYSRFQVAVDQQRKILEVNENLRNVSQAKTDLVSSFSHDIRTPLSVLSGITDLLSETELTKKQERHVLSLKRASKQILDLVCEVEEISKIEPIVYKNQIDTFKISELFETVKKNTEAAFKINSLNLDFNIINIENDLLKSDQKALEHVLTNLINIVSKTTLSGVVETLIQAEDNSNRVSFKVTGINFDTSKRRALLSDMNLHLTNIIIKRLGGTFLIGEDFSLSFSIPTGPTKQSLPLNQKEDTQSKQQNSISFKKPPVKLLIVEDDFECREMLKDQLEQSNYQVDYAKDGYEGVKLIQSKHYDLIITDLNMPIWDGEAVLNKTRDMEARLKLKETPIYAFSGSTQEKEVERFYQAGFDGFIPKPFDKSHFHNVIRDFKDYHQKGEFLSLYCAN